MASIPSPLHTSQNQHEPPHTPSSSQLRNRAGVASSSSIFVTGGFPDAANVSPTLSTFSVGSTVLVTGEGSSLNTPAYRTAIRVDHSITTCFDPADKELYDLWAPKT
ncbi:hypothetical protein BC834DRAFT_968464 [Gloeopeniophorella convolvens]|nr:hypothetical protein BC834DRAFT_968464 [Gloeopeniophorella convolvens]